MKKTNVSSSVKNKEEKNLKSLDDKGIKLHVTSSQYGTDRGYITINDPISNQFHPTFKQNLKIINKLSKTNPISVSVRNQLKHQPKNSLTNLIKPPSSAIQPNKIIQLLSNKIKPLELKSSISTLNCEVSKTNDFKQMATNTKQLTIEDIKKSLLKSNQTSEQLNDKNIDSSAILELISQDQKQSTESIHNNFAGKLQNIQTSEIENNCLTENIAKDQKIQLPKQFSAITISKAGNITHRKEEPPLVSISVNQPSLLLPQQINISTQSNKNLNIAQTDDQNLSSTSKIQLPNCKFINIGNDKNIVNIKTDNRISDNDDNASFILNPITGYFETIQNMNGHENLKQCSILNKINENVEEDFNGPPLTDIKFENNNIQKILKNEPIDENDLNKFELVAPGCKTICSNLSLTNMKENIHSINSEALKKEGESGHLIKEKLEKKKSETNEELRGPRTKVRAKSMYLQKQVKYKKRKSLPCTNKDIFYEKNTEKNQNCNVLASNLLCNEKIQISPDILKPQESDNQIIYNLITSIKNHNTVSEQFSGNEIIDLADSESLSLSSSGDIQYLSDCGSVNLETSKKYRNVSKSCINNIGVQLNDNDIVRNCRLPHNFNKFGLLALNEKQPINRENIGPLNYEKPIYFRDNKSSTTANYANNLYFCKGCHFYGEPIDFLSVNFCSKECIDKIEKKKIHSSNDVSKAIIKGEKRQRRNLSLLPSKISNVIAQQKIQSNILLENSKPVFSWKTYLNLKKAEAAEINLFLNPFPCGPNLFEVGMKLEAIDPEHNSLFCVCTVIEKKGFRLKIHFDGYSPNHDFWINADSMDIFPPGWCAKNQRILTPPKSYTVDDFNWTTYLINKKAIAAPRQIFTHLNSCSNTNPFKVGMKFEANDLRSISKVRVASVVDVLDNRILMHFDGCDENSYYWIDCESPYIHPVNWHLYNNYEFVQPSSCTGTFVWKKYIEDTNGIPVTDEIINIREPIGFKPGMKLEIVDKKNPSLIRPATVIMADKYDLKILYDGWPPDYAFRVVDDSPDIHPVSWCETTGHELEPPPDYHSLPKFMPCPMQGCRGIGNVKRIDIEFHAILRECPYELSNWSKDINKPDRIGHSILKLSNMNLPIKLKSNESIEYGGNRLLNIAPVLQSSTPKIITRQTASSTSVADSETAYLMAPSEEITNEIDQMHISSQRMKVAKKLLIDYGPRLEGNLHYWSKNFTKICVGATQNQIEILEKNPLQWSINEVYEFIRDIPQCNNIAEIFKSNEIDGEALLSIRQDDLPDIFKIKLGPSIKVYSFIIYLRGEVLERYTK